MMLETPLCVTNESGCLELISYSLFEGILWEFEGRRKAGDAWIEGGEVGEVLTSSTSLHTRLPSVFGGLKYNFES